MDRTTLPAPDQNGIIPALPENLSEANCQKLRKFGTFMFLYDLIQDHFVRPYIHKASAKRHHQIVKTQISFLKDARVLDIGCGTGAAIPHFDSSNEYTGLDLSYAMLKEARKKLRTNPFKHAMLIQGSAEQLPFGDGSFDFVLMDTTLHMIPEYRSAVSEIARVLTTGGIWVCTTPAVGLNEAFDANWKKISGKRGLHSFTETELQGLCLQNGLNYHRHDTNGGVLYFSASKQSTVMI